jgi:hypothetical protein
MVDFNLIRDVGAVRKLLHDMSRSSDIVRARHGFYRCKNITVTS